MTVVVWDADGADDDRIVHFWDCDGWPRQDVDALVDLVGKIDCGTLVAVVRDADWNVALEQAASALDLLWVRRPKLEEKHAGALRRCMPRVMEVLVHNVEIERCYQERRRSTFVSPWRSTVDFSPGHNLAELDAYVKRLNEVLDGGTTFDVDFTRKAGS